jgi:hypothetical protein
MYLEQLGTHVGTLSQRGKNHANYLGKNRANFLLSKF